VPTVGDVYPHELEVGAPRRRLRPVQLRDPDGLLPSAEPRTFKSDDEAREQGFRDGLSWYEKVVSPSMEGTEAGRDEAQA
jgi:hypothetical protein